MILSKSDVRKINKHLAIFIHWELYLILWIGNYDHLPCQRRLYHEVAKLLEMKVIKKLLQQHLTSGTGMVITQEDISNAQTEINQSCDSNNLDKLVRSSLFIQVLQLNFTLMTRISLQDFFKDSIMKPIFFLYPELITVNAVYKLNFSTFMAMDKVKLLECIRPHKKHKKL